MSADVPPTLVAHEPPMLVEGPAEVAAAASLSAKKVVMKGSLSQLEDILNSVLPPRYVYCK